MSRNQSDHGWHIRLITSLKIWNTEIPMSDVCCLMSDVQSLEHRIQDQKLGPNHVVSEINGQGRTHLEK